MAVIGVRWPPRWSSRRHRSSARADWRPAAASAFRSASGPPGPT